MPLSIFMSTGRLRRTSVGMLTVDDPNVDPIAEAIRLRNEEDQRGVHALQQRLAAGNITNECV